METQTQKTTFSGLVRRLPGWASVLVLWASLVGAQSFGSLSTLAYFARGFGMRATVPLQIFFVFVSAAVSLALYELLDRALYLLWQNMTRGGVLCDRRSFLKDLRAYQSLRFIFSTPFAVLSFFYPLWLAVFSAVQLALMLASYAAFFLAAEKTVLAPYARKRALLVLFVPVLLYVLVTGVAL